MFTKVSALTLAVASLATAVYTPVGDTPSGNAFITPGRGQAVPACKQFSITWTPTSSQKISILLLRGPSENVVPIGAPLADSIDNTGSFSWTPSSDLEADVTHYGLRIIQEDGKFQWSDQFGISKDGDCKSTSSSSSAGGYGYGASSSAASSSAASSSAAPSSAKNVTSSAIPTSAGTITAVVPSGTGNAGSNTTVVTPTVPMTVPETLKTSATAAPTGSSTGSGSAPKATGAAGQVRAGLGLVAALGGLAFML